MAGRPSTMRLEDAERLLLSLELFGMRFGLDRMRRLLTALGSPQERFASVHVVGTNGKSSTVRMTAAILRRHGLHVGAYLSPHLVSFAERVRVDDADVSGAEFAAAVARALPAALVKDGASEAVRRLIDRVGLVQIDSVNVLQRAHYLPLFSRVGPYDLDLLDRASWYAPRRLFEYWGHEASLLPVELFPLLRWRMEAAGAKAAGWNGLIRLAQERPDYVEAVYEEGAERRGLHQRRVSGAGPPQATDCAPFGGSERSERGGRSSQWRRAAPSH